MNQIHIHIRGTNGCRQQVLPVFSCHVRFIASEISSKAAFPRKKPSSLTAYRFGNRSATVRMIFHWNSLLFLISSCALCCHVTSINAISSDDIYINTSPMRLGNMKKQLPAIIERDDDGFISLCPELDIASQGDTIEEARENLREAIELFLEYASPAEIKNRFHEEIYITRLEIAVG
jgi:predicted RNase H-like HicB family nuclease